MRVTASIAVNAPLEACFNFISDFENIPRYLHGYKEVKQLDDTRLYLRAEFLDTSLGRRREYEWNGLIVRTIPYSGVRWKSTSGYYREHNIDTVEDANSMVRIFYMIIANEDCPELTQNELTVSLFTLKGIIEDIVKLKG